MSLLISLLILCIVFGILAYVLSLLPIAQPWMNVARAVLALIFLVALLNLVGWVGEPFYLHHGRW